VRVTTARYSNYQGIAESELIPVRITLGHPRWQLPYQLGGIVKELAPTRELFKVRDDDEFDRRFCQHLDSIGLETIAAKLTDVFVAHPGTDGLVLLCYEDLRVHGERSCHRRTFARWWEAKTGRPCPELPDNGPIKGRKTAPKTPGPDTPSLF